ncbi:MAG: septation protein IspZ [Gammaproteobacteria bacterium]|nr:septation protein IspZ [Gammaproteobacteria bacterium]
MKQLLEFLPIILFFVVYKLSGSTIELFGWSYTLDGIYSATIAIMLSYPIVLIIDTVLRKKVDKKLFWTAVVVIALGALTLGFHSAAFIQWKPTLVNWVLALGIVVPKLFGKRSWIKLAMGGQLELTSKTWARLEWTWVVYLFSVGLLNLVVAYQFSEAFWVDYKLYSAVGFSIIIVVITSFIVMPDLKQNNREENQ